MMRAQTAKFSTVGLPDYSAQKQHVARRTTWFTSLLSFKSRGDEKGSFPEWMEEKIMWVMIASAQKSIICTEGRCIMRWCGWCPRSSSKQIMQLSFDENHAAPFEADDPIFANTHPRFMSSSSYWCDASGPSWERALSSRSGIARHWGSKLEQCLQQIRVHQFF